MAAFDKRAHDAFSRNIIDVLNYCDERTAISVIVPFPLVPEEIAALHDCPGILKVDEAATPIRADLHAITSSVRHSRGREILFAGPGSLLPVDFLMSILGSGRLHVTCHDGDNFRSVSVFSLLLAAFRNYLARRLRRLPEDHPAIRTVQVLGRIPWLTQAWRATSYPDARGEDEELYFRLVRLHAGIPYIPVKRRIVHVNTGLAVGGTERQIILTMHGLKNAGFDDLTFLGQQVLEVAGLDFHAWRLREVGIEVAQAGRTPSTYAIDARTMTALGELPRRLMEDIEILVMEFQQRRPAVVHAWQDPSSIAAGIAGVIAGVPRLVLACRNVNPSHFASHQPYMRPAWRALSSLPQVRIVANSKAGALSYARWLELPCGRIDVIENGFDAAFFSRPNDEVLWQFRKNLGIPQEAPVVCGVFRFWPEKRPDLWIKTAQEIASRRPDTRFVLIGDGPLKAQTTRLSRKLGIVEQVFFLGNLQDIVTPMAAADILLLTSAHEGLPNVLMEAQALGVATVTTDAGGAREAIDDEMMSFVTADDTPASLAEKTVALIADAELRTRVKTNGRDAMIRRFGSEKMIKRTLSAYEFG